MLTSKHCGVQQHSGVHSETPELLTSTPPVTRVRLHKPGSIALTKRQAEFLAFINDFGKKHGLPPSRSELRAALGLGTHSTVEGYLQRIAAKGWLKLTAGRDRAIRLLRPGAPIYEPEDFRTTTVLAHGRDEDAREPQWIDCELLWQLFGGMPDFCLRIRGDAMNKAGLTDGGIVALKLARDDQGEEPVLDGDVVAARVGDDVVLRRYHRVGDRTLELQPQSTNRHHTAIRVDKATDVEIIGVVIGRMLPGGG